MGRHGRPLQHTHTHTHTYLHTKSKKETKEKIKRFKAGPIKRLCHQGQKITVLAILERLE